MSEKKSMIAIAISKSICKEYSTYSYSRVVYLENGQEFQIQLFNPHNFTIGAEIFINDEKLSNGMALSRAIPKIMALAESYPELKANENFAKLSADLTKIEDEIANSRKYYNGAVRELNNKIQMFPGNIVAGVFGFKQANMFEANAEERNNVKVSL